MIRIFVSSTFHDMHEERDVLHSIIVPNINKELEQYGEEIEVVDYRWGVDTS